METGHADVAVELACFRAGGVLYGVDVLQVREIVRAQAVTPLPNAPALIEGVIDLRGAVLPVVDLGRALGGRAAEGADVRIAVIEHEELALGLRVDAAVDVLGAPAHCVETAPALATNAGYDAVRAIVRRDGAPPVLVLSLEHLLESVYRSARGGEPREPRSGGQ
jgi:purine-binding chemotaxis protein CheW